MHSSSKAIPFILKNPQTQLYELSIQAENFIKNLSNPLSIVTVAGLYRTGKSYLLNRVILNKSEGFNVGPTVNPCTKGLWIWNQPIHTQDNKQVLVVDTEGLGALDQEANHDMKIFSLAVLLSTTFIYNSVGNIDQSALQTLSLVLNLVGNIDQQKQSTRPSFIWVVRDFSLQLIDQKGNTISPKQYLQMALNSDGVKQSQKCQIRKNIANAFDDRDCFTLYKPLIDQQKLQKLDSIPLQQLRPEFVSQTMALRKKIFNNLNTIKLSNCSLKGSQYVTMVKRYLDAINEGRVPNIMDTWTFIKEQKARIVAEQLIQNYTQKIKVKIMSRLPLKFNQLQEYLNSIWSEMVDQFRKGTYQQTSTQQIQQFFHRIKSQIKNANEDQMKTFLKNLLNKQFQVFSKKIFSDYYATIQQFTLDIDKNFKQMIVSSYSQKVQGLNASISSFLEKKYVEAFKYFSTKLKLQIKKITQHKEEIQISLKKQNQRIKANSAQYQHELKLKLAEMDRKLLEMTRKSQEAQKLLQLQKQSNKEKNSESKSKFEYLQSTLSQLQKKYQENQNQKKRIEKELYMIKKQNDKELALMRQKNDYLSRQHQDQQKRYQDMKRLLDEKMQVQEQQKKKFYSSNQQRFKILIQENQAKSDKIFELEHKILELTEQFNDRIFKLQQKENRLAEQKQKMKENLIQDFSNKKQSQSHQINSLRDQCRKYQEQLQVYSLQKAQYEHKVRQLAEQLKHSKYSSEKQIAIHLQRIQFHEVQIRQLKHAIDQQKKNSVAIIQNLQSSTKNTDERYSTKVKQITFQYQNQIKSIQKDFSQKIYETKKQLASLKTIKEDLQIELSLEKKKCQSKEKQYKQNYSKLQSLYQNLTQKLSNSEKDFHDLNQQKQQYFTMRIKQLQKQVQQTKQKSMKQLEQSQKSSEQALGILKNYTQIQRHQWQKRFQDQKDKNNKNIQNIKSQYQKKLMEEKQALQDQNSMLEDRIDQMQKYINETIQNLKYNHEIEVQKLTNQFVEQKKEVDKKNALLSQEMQLTKLSLQSQLDESKRNFENTLQSLKRELQNELTQQQIRYKQQRQFLESKCQSLKKTNKTVEQQNLILKNELDKEKALYKQKQSSHLKNINDLEDRLSHQLFNHTKTIEEITNTNSVQRKRLNTEIDYLKCQKAKLEQQKSTISMEKDSIQSKLNAKLNYLQNKIKTNKTDYDDLMNKFQVTSSFLNKKIQTMQKDKQQIHNKARNQFQQQISQKQDNYKKENKDYNDRIYRLQTQNKTLRDKVILMQVRLGSSESSKINLENSQFERLEEMKEEYSKREQQYRKMIQKLKKQNKKLKDEMQIRQLTANYDKTKNIGNQYKDFSQRDSIINGLNEHSRQDGSRSRVNLDNSKFMNTSNFNQSRMNTTNALGDNKTLINRKSNVSPMMTNKKYTNTKNIRPQQYQSNTRYY